MREAAMVRSTSLGGNAGSPALVASHHRQVGIPRRTKLSARRSLTSVNRVMRCRLVFVVAILPLLSANALAQQDPSANAFHGLPPSNNLSDAETESKIESMLKRMTLEEKVGQLVQYSAGTPTGPGTGRSGYEEMIEKGQVGSLFNLGDAKAANH